MDILDSHEDSAETEKFLMETLLASCEKAFRKGLNSAEIYEALMSIDHIETPKEAKFLKLFVIQRFFKRIFKLLRRLFWVVFFILLSIAATCTVLSYLTCNLWPISVKSRCLLPSHPLVMEVSRPIANCSICDQYLDSGSPIIELMASPSRATFNELAYLSKPIIIRGGAISTGMTTNFTFETLKSLFESEPDGIESVAEECQFLPFRSSFKNLQEVFDKVSTDSGYPDTPWYIGWSNCHPGIAGKLRKYFPRPKFLPTDSESSVIDWIFIGSPGYGASMHLDYVRRPSWQAQLTGRKKWILNPPPECESLCSQFLSLYINAGDMLFLDTNSWYHETYIEGSQLSISIGSEYD